MDVSLKQDWCPQRLNRLGTNKVRFVRTVSSILDALKPGDRLGLLAGDKFFTSETVVQAANDRNFELTIYRTVEEVSTDLEKALRRSAFAEAWAAHEKREDRVKVALENDVDPCQDLSRSASRVRLRG